MRSPLFWQVAALAHVADPGRASTLADSVGSEIDRMATAGLTLRVVSMDGELFAGVIGGVPSGSGGLLGGVLETVPGDRRTFERKVLETWSRAGRVVRRYNSRPRSADAPSAAGLNPDLFDEVVRASLPFISFDFVPLVRRTDLAKVRLGVGAASPALRWAISVAVMGTDLSELNELDRLLFLPRSGNSLAGPVRLASEDDALVQLAAWHASGHRPGACASSDDLRRALVLAHPSERVDPAARTVPLMGVGPDRREGKGALDGLRGRVVSRHVLVTGDPGTGKSTAVQEWLGSLASEPDSPVVLVLDPVKRRDEYTLLSQRGFSVFDARSWVPLNPLVSPPDVDKNDFASFFVSALDEATGLSETFPLGASVLRNAVRTATSSAEPGAATIADVVRMLSERLATLPAGGGRADDAAAVAFSVRERVIDVADALGEGSLCGDALAGVPWEFLLSNNCVVLLGGLRDESQRQLVGMLLAAGLTRHQLNAENPPRRLLALEESHTFFPRGPEARGVVEEIMSRAVAEQRSKRLGLVFVDQRPTSLPDAVVANCGSVVAFRNSDAKECLRVAAKLNLGADGDQVLTALPDFMALVRIAGESSAHRVGFVEPSGLPQSVVASDADLFPRHAVLPWCEQCPYPCQGSFVLDSVRSGVVGLAAESTSSLPDPDDPETAFLEGLVSSVAAAASGSGRVADFDPLGDGTPNTVQIAATYCGSAHSIAVDKEIPVQLRIELMDRIGKWTRRGSFR